MTDDKKRQRELERRRAYWACFLGENQQPNPNGARVLASLRKFCGVDRGGIVVSPVQRMTDPYATAYLAGQRDVYNHIIKMLDTIKEKDDARPESEPER